MRNIKNPKGTFLLC